VQSEAPAGASLFRGQKLRLSILYSFCGSFGGASRIVCPPARNENLDFVQTR